MQVCLNVKLHGRGDVGELSHFLLLMMLSTKLTYFKDDLNDDTDYMYWDMHGAYMSPLA